MRLLFVAQVVFLILVPLTLPNIAWGEDDAAILVKLSTDPKAEKTHWVGSRIRLIVDVLGRDGWANVPTLPALDIPGAIVYHPSGQSIRLNETEGGESYSGQRNEWWIYPRRPGEMKIAPIEIEIAVQSFAPQHDPGTISKTTQEISLDVVRSENWPGADTEVVVTEKLSAEQTWKGDTQTVKVGDGITREITRTIADAPPLVLPPIEFAELDATSRYLRQSTTSESSNRGDLIGTRTDSATYVFKRPGEIVLPSIEVFWLEPENGEQQSITLDGLTVDVAAVASEAANDPSSPDTATRYLSARPLIALAIAALVLAFVGWRWFPHLRTWQRTRQESERAVFERLCRALQSGHTRESFQSLRDWIGRLFPHEHPDNEQFLCSGGIAYRESGLDPLYVAMDRGEAQFDGKRLLQSVKQARLHALAKKRSHAPTPLPPLNP